MKHLIQEIRDLFNNPRLLIQYVVLNFFLLSVGVAAVVYTKKEMALEQSRVQSQQILKTTGKLESVQLPENVEKSVTRLKEGAQQTLEETGPATSDPKVQGSSTK